MLIATISESTVIFFIFKFLLFPSFFSERLMKFRSMVAIIALQPARLLVSAVVGHSFRHQIAFVKLVEQHETLLLLMDVIVDPHFIEERTHRRARVRPR